MFHVGGPYALLWALIYGGSTVVVEAFSVSRFWDVVRRYEITTVGLLGSMAQFLVKQPESADDTKHPLLSVIIAPFDENAIAFGKRFRVPIYTEFNMTELAVPLWAGPNPQVSGSCGRPQPGVELRLVDEHDIEVPPGAAGELVVRAAEPWTISHGYLNDAAATARAWRNGWFHTGDLVRRDAAGNYFFVDRLNDALRRRGENISSAEVEAPVLAHPDVRECAAIGVPSEFGEHDVMLVVLPREGCGLTAPELFDYLRPRLPRFMLPRYIEFVADFPRTPTEKIQKAELRRRGVTEGT
jgi:crotonobetaine/carnitine-CoA ligase